jgi:hypothetical protein
MCYRSSFGVLKGSSLNTKARATLFLDHLLDHYILSEKSKMMQKKDSQKFANRQTSIVLGPQAHEVQSGRLPVQFALVRGPLLQSR